MRLCTIKGDQNIALSWLPWAKSRLIALKNQMSATGVSVGSRYYPLSDAYIVVRSAFGQDVINIEVTGGKFVLVCHVGTDTGINGYTKKFYQIEAGSLVEITPQISGSFYTLGYTVLRDDGKYFLNYDYTTYDDPDSYTYNFNPSGLIAEDGSGTPAILKYSNYSARFILNQAFEEEFFKAYVTDVDGTDRSYLVLDDSLTFRPYKVKGNPVFNRYTEDSVVYMHSRTEHDASLVLRNDLYQNGVADGFGDVLFTINKIYEKKLATSSKTEQTVNSDANGVAVFGATRYYRDKRTAQDVGRIKTFASGPYGFAEPAVRETYPDGSTQETFHRCADGGNTCFFMRGNLVSGTQLDLNGNVLEPGFDTIANDVKLPYTFNDLNALDYVRMEKDDNFTNLTTGLYVADTLIESSGYESILFLADGIGGTQDAASGKWIAENNGPIAVRKTVYTILHAHHDQEFDMAFYKKTVFQNYTQELLPYRQARVLGSQSAAINGQLKKTCVISESTYFVAVNGVKTELPYKYTAREYTLTSESVDDSDVGHPIIYTFIDLPWVDIGYDSGGSPITTETNRQITRVFTTADNGKLLLSFDVWDAKSKHDVVYDSSNPAYKYLWADYDTGVTVFPPLVDLFSIQDRKWLLFNTGGSYEEITPPKTAGINYERVNGLAMLGV